MADISFYKYLEAAFRHKLFKDTKATSFNFLGFNLPYESLEGKKGIFEYARRVLPSFYSLHFADTEEGHLQMAKDFLQKLDRKTDPDLPKYFNPAQAPAEYEPVIQEAKIASAAPAAMPESSLPPPPVPKAPPTRRIVILPSSKEEEEGEKPAPAEPVTTPPPQETGATPSPTAGVSQPPSMSFSSSLGQPPPERKDKEKKKRWFGRLRSGGSFFDFLPIKQAARWIWRNMLRPVLNFAWRSILQPALRWLAGQAGRLLFQFLPRLALGALNALAGLLGGIGGLSGIAFAATSALFWGVIAVVSFVVVTILATFLSPFINNPTLEAPTPISSCQFTRGNMTPPAAAYQSSFILDLFQNASKVTTVPPEVLAAIARVESPSVTSKTDADFPTLNSVAGCTHSDTGALGIMQIQPPDTTGYFKPGVELGASFLRKTVDQLTEEDYCDVRNNIIIAGGIIIKKIQGNGTKWDPAWTNDRNVINELAEGYYGCLNYGDPANPNKCVGPYNYGDDLWTSIQSCRTTLIPGQIRPPSEDPQALHDQILTNYKIDLDINFPKEYLTWAWEKLEEISNSATPSRFLQLVNPKNTPITITRNDQLINAQIGKCPDLKISMRGMSGSTGQPYPEPLFKVVFIHELSHLIESCNLANSQKIKLQEEIILSEGYLTNYSLNADQCVGANNVNEDYAETIAYFLNENYPEQSLGIGQACEPTQSKNPIYSGKKPYHRQFAIELLLRNE